MPFMNFLPPGAELPDVFAHNPEAYAGIGGTMRHVMRGEGAFSEGERELMGAFVSALNACDYCAGGHAAAAVAFGVAPDLLQALVDDLDAAPIAEKLKPVFAYLRKLTLSPARLLQADADAVYAVGWDEQALHVVVMLGAFFAFANRAVFGHGIEDDPAKHEARGAQHRGSGYVGLANTAELDGN